MERYFPEVYETMVNALEAKLFRKLPLSLRHLSQGFCGQFCGLVSLGHL